jgi:hypothetical protein
MCAVSILIDWLFFNSCTSIFCDPQSHPRSSANRHCRAFAPFQDPVYVRYLIIFHYTPVVQGPTLRAPMVAGERVDARVVRMNKNWSGFGKVTAWCPFQLSSSFRNMVYCDITVRTWFMTSSTDRLHQTGHCPSSLSLMGWRALGAESLRLV